MASDSSGRHPTGVLSRPAPDFFDDNVGFGGVFKSGILAPGMESWQRASLFNNATDGRSLKVYGISTMSDWEGCCFVYGVYGQPTDTFVGTCSPLSFNGPMPWGLLYFQNTVVAAAAPNPYNPPTNAAWLGVPFTASVTMFSQFPIAIVPAGYALLVVGQQPGGVFGASFWFQMSNE